MRKDKPNPPFYRLSKRKMVILLSLMVAIQLLLLSLTFKGNNTADSLINKIPFVLFTFRNGMNNNWFWLSADNQPAREWISRTAKEFIDENALRNLAKDVQEKSNARNRIPIPVITSCSSKYFERLKNLVGSIHFWEPHLQVCIL